MMTLLVFLSLIFTLLGLVVTQYINIYKDSYELWTLYCVYNKKETLEDGSEDEEKKKIICSKVESLSRQVCEINDILGAVIRTLHYSITIIFLVIGINISQNIVTNEIDIEIAQNIASLLLTYLTYLAVRFITKALKIEKGYYKLDSIERKLFEVWWKLKCHREKLDGYKSKSKPSSLYKTFLKYVTEGKITEKELTDDEKKLIEELKKKDFTEEIPTWFLP